MPCFVFGNGFVDLLNDRLAMPLSGASIPVVESNLATEMKHECFKRRGRVELKANGMQLLLGGEKVGPKTP